MNSNKVASLIDRKSSDKGIASQVASYLIDTKQTLKLDPLMRDVMSARELAGTYELDVTSAHELSQLQLGEIKAYIKAHFANCKHVTIHQKVDPTLLGGIRIESANYLIDRSLKSQLNHIKSHIDN